ncbi:hypothetical protein [Mesorhizobium sp. WSM4906]|uniref:hypothetical protein n=1 Tax=Mesorhizobium sp. WSM4906 TaxID=3038546 RepID=UPI002416DF02|nr:hypothetical protein [Mesorhizobium sp. WSM4906]WFP74368.1 hypothetical protein QAZ22_21815 [Mesorhizobium sp. WSM4906]
MNDRIGLSEQPPEGDAVQRLRWLREEVVPILEHARAHPELLLTSDQLRRNLSDHIRSIVFRHQ